MTLSRWGLQEWRLAARLVQDGNTGILIVLAAIQVLQHQEWLWHCQLSRLGRSDSSWGRGIAAPSLHSQGHCIGGEGASPSALHQCHQRGQDRRHSCLQDQKTTFLCGKPKNHRKQIAPLIIRARQKPEQPLENLVTYWYSENVGTHFERPAGTLWKARLGGAPQVHMWSSCWTAAILNELKGWNLVVGGETASPWDLHW